MKIRNVISRRHALKRWGRQAAWWKQGGYLLFNDIHNDRRMKYAPGQGVTLFKQGVNRANGLTRDLQFPGAYRVTPDLGTLTLVTDSFVGPNGLAFSPDEKTYINDVRRGQSENCRHTGAGGEE